jgi:carotenoid 1,2-hydratase
VIYDVRPVPGVAARPADRLIARRFAPDGSSDAFEPPPRRRLPRSRWGLSRAQRADDVTAVRVQQTLEDTPFYARSVIGASLLGEAVTAMHETLHVPRLVSLPVQLMLPLRMPRRS